MEKKEIEYDPNLKLPKKGELGDYPFMTKDEINCILSYLKKSHIMLEWGSGGSTLYYPKFVRKYISIEHNPEWHKIVSNKVKEKGYKNVDMHLVEPNEQLVLVLPTKQIVEKFMDVEDISIKKINLLNGLFNNYYGYIEKLKIPKFDAILVDGRARLYCALSALNYIDENSVMFIHDFYMHKDYQYIERFMDVIDHIGKFEYLGKVGLGIEDSVYGRRGTLAVLKKKPMEEFESINDLIT